MSPSSLDINPRKSIRLPGYDYASVGAYFVTICTHERTCFLAQIEANEIMLLDTGKLVEACWLEIPDHFGHVLLDEFVIMPNHLHGIIVLSKPGLGATHGSPNSETQRAAGPKRGSLAAILAGFKGATGRQINILRNSSGAPVWQRNYYEHVIRNEADLSRIQEYIQTNPLRWMEDENHPEKIKNG